MPEEVPVVAEAPAVAPVSAPVAEASPAVTAAVPAAEAPAKPAPPAWSDLVAGIEDEKLREHAAKFDGLPAMVKGNQDLRSALSKPREGFVKLPTEQSTPEERAAYNKALGIPDAPEAYGIAPPDGSPEHIKERYGAFLKAMHTTGAPRAVVEQALKFHAEVTAADVAAEQAKIVAEAEAGRAKLRQEWLGPDYDRNHALAHRTLAHFATDDAIREFEKSGLDQSPALIRMFAQIGKLTAEDVPAIAQERASIDGEFAAMELEEAEKFGTAAYQDPAFVARRAAVYAKRYN